MTHLDPNALFPIREVSRLTGVKPITLRAWERRYDLIEPVRTESGHRLYTQEHIDYLNQALKLMDEGIPISRVKTVLSENPQHIHTPRHQPSDSELPGLVEQIAEACDHGNTSQIERWLDRLFADYSLKPLLPILVQIDQHISKGQRNNLSLNLWQSALMQRLQVRLHAYQTHSLTPSRRIFVQRSSHSPLWLAKLVALYCYEQGYQGISLDQIIPLEKVAQLKQHLHLYGIILIDQDGSSTLEWQVWFEQLASLKTWVWGGENIEEQTPPSVNCELRAWPNWLQPLNR